MDKKYWKTNNMEVEYLGRAKDSRFVVIKLLSPLCNNKGNISYDIGTEIIVTDKELE